MKEQRHKPESEFNNLTTNIPPDQTIVDFSQSLLPPKVETPFEKMKRMHENQKRSFDDERERE